MHIIGHNWIKGRLKLKVEWNSEQSLWEELQDMKEDHPKMTAGYLVDANETSRLRRDDFHLDNNNKVYAVCCAVQHGNKKRKKKYGPKPQFKYGVQKVPRNMKQAGRFDEANNNTLWSNSIKLEIKVLTDLECFAFRDPDYNCGEEYQQTTLTLIFGVKQDLRHKARLVARGHPVDTRDPDVYSSMVNGLSVKLLHVIAHKANMSQLCELCGNVGNAYVNAFTKEKV
jgi:hypothetical protein